MIVQLAILVVAMILSYALAPKPETQPPPAFDDFDWPQVDEGTPQAVFFGDCWTADWMVLAVGDYRTEPVKSDGGKK